MISLKRDGEHLICVPETNVVASNVPEMRDYILENWPEESSWENFVFDCKNVETLDSMGINLLVGILKKTKGENKKIKIINCNPSIVKVLHLFRLDQLFGLENANANG